jgi:hypothetical protein
VRIYGSDKALKKDILYVITDDTLPDTAPAKQEITILLPSDLAAHMPEGYQWISVPEKKSLSQIIGSIQDVFREFQEWYVRAGMCNRFEVLCA